MADALKILWQTTAARMKRLKQLIAHYQHGDFTLMCVSYGSNKARQSLYPRAIKAHLRWCHRARGVITPPNTQPGVPHCSREMAFTNKAQRKHLMHTPGSLQPG